MRRQGVVSANEGIPSGELAALDVRWHLLVLASAFAGDGQREWRHQRNHCISTLSCLTLGSNVRLTVSLIYAHASSRWFSVWVVCIDKRSHSAR